MKHPERVEDYLEHTAEAIERATGYLQPVPDLQAFQNNPQVQDAVIRNIDPRATLVYGGERSRFTPEATHDHHT
jgi:uncharacterized protein with HEPN domain